MKLRTFQSLALSCRTPNRRRSTMLEPWAASGVGNRGRKQWAHRGGGQRRFQQKGKKAGMMAAKNKLLDVPRAGLKGSGQPSGAVMPPLRSQQQRTRTTGEDARNIANVRPLVRKNEKNQGCVHLVWSRLCRGWGCCEAATSSQLPPLTSSWHGRSPQEPMTLERANSPRSNDYVIFGGGRFLEGKIWVSERGGCQERGLERGNVRGYRTRAAYNSGFSTFCTSNFY